MGGRWALGVDIGSVTVKVLLLDGDRRVQFDSYLRTMGAPLDALVAALAEARAALPPGVEIGAVGTTGSGRELAGALLGADVIKNEITTHAVGAIHCNPGIRTIIEIGGQDSKLIHLRDGMVVDFAMNSVCAAGTGAFLDQQAERLRIPIERFGEFALTAQKPVRIAGRCCVFAESDMIHKQQAGHDRAGICLGLCQALVRNYLNNVAGGKRLEGPVSLQGGVAYNKAILQCFREALPKLDILLPERVTGCGALGAALLGQEHVGAGGTRFRGWLHGQYSIREEPCTHCANQCDLFCLIQDAKEIARWGGRCGRNRVGREPHDQPACVSGNNSLSGCPD
jgi:predicted CoA-substrate-specific enzyme activase